MKKIILLLILIGVASIATSYANAPVTVNKRTMTAFHATFKKASDVQWTNGSNYLQVQFTLDKQVMFAYYKPNGDLICTLRNILTTELPASLRKMLKNNYGNYWVTDLIEVHTDQGYSYYVKLENADTNLTLSADRNSNWTVFRESPKNASLVTVYF